MLHISLKVFFREGSLIQLNKVNDSNLHLLNHAIDNGIIDVAYVLEQSANLKRGKILRTHKTEYWHSKGKVDCWYWRNPNKAANPTRKLVKRKTQKGIEDVVFDYYSQIEMEEERRANRNRMSFEELFYEMMEDKKPKRASGTIKKNMQEWRKYIKPHQWFIEKPFVDITKIEVDRLFGSIIKEHQLKQTQFGNIVGLVKQSYEYAIDAEYIDKSPYRIKVNKKLIEKNRKKDSIGQVFQANEQELLIQEMERRLRNNPSNTATLAVILDFEVGLRKDEMLALRDSDIDYQRKTVSVSRQVIQTHALDDMDSIKHTGYEIVNYTKSDSGTRKVPLTDKALELIHQIKEINDKYHQPFEDYLFIKNGHLLPFKAIDSQLILGCKRIGISTRTMHKIRKTYASTLYKRGIDVLIISKLLGHSDIKTTMDNYIFELEDEEIIFQNVVEALQYHGLEEKVTKGDQKIVSFEEMKRRKTS